MLAGIIGLSKLKFIGKWGPVEPSVLYLFLIAGGGGGVGAKD
jgi:hypothetical protein